MSQNNLPQTLPSLQKLLIRISAAEKSQQKEIRITIQEARDLTIELSLLTANLGKAIQEINQGLKQINDNNNKIEVKFEGGRF